MCHGQMVSWSKVQGTSLGYTHYLRCHCLLNQVLLYLCKLMDIIKVSFMNVPLLIIMIMLTDPLGSASRVVTSLKLMIFIGDATE